MMRSTCIFDSDLRLEGLYFVMSGLQTFSPCTLSGIKCECCLSVDTLRYLFNLEDERTKLNLFRQSARSGAG